MSQKPPLEVTARLSETEVEQEKIVNQLVVTIRTPDGKCKEIRSSPDLGEIQAHRLLRKMDKFTLRLTAKNFLNLRRSFLLAAADGYLLLENNMCDCSADMIVRQFMGTMEQLIEFECQNFSGYNRWSIPIVPIVPINEHVIVKSTSAKSFLESTSISTHDCLYSYGRREQSVDSETRDLLSVQQRHTSEEALDETDSRDSLATHPNAGNEKLRNYSFILPVSEKLFREIRIHNTRLFPTNESIDVYREYVEQEIAERMRIRPSLTTVWAAVGANLRDEIVLALYCMFKLGESSVVYFEQNNFESNVSWAQPKELYHFARYFQSVLQLPDKELDESYSLLAKPQMKDDLLQHQLIVEKISGTGGVEQRAGACQSAHEHVEVNSYREETPECCVETPILLKSNGCEQAEANENGFSNRETSRNADSSAREAQGFHTPCGPSNEEAVQYSLSHGNPSQEDNEQLIQSDRLEEEQEEPVEQFYDAVSYSESDLMANLQESEEEGVENPQNSPTQVEREEYRRENKRRRHRERKMRIREGKAARELEQQQQNLQIAVEEVNDIAEEAALEETNSAALEPVPVEPSGQVIDEHPGLEQAFQGSNNGTPEVFLPEPSHEWIEEYQDAQTEMVVAPEAPSEELPAPETPPEEISRPPSPTPPRDDSPEVNDINVPRCHDLDRLNLYHEMKIYFDENIDSIIDNPAVRKQYLPRVLKFRDVYRAQYEICLLISYMRYAKRERKLSEKFVVFKIKSLVCPEFADCEFLAEHSADDEWAAKKSKWILDRVHPHTIDRKILADGLRLIDLKCDILPERHPLYHDYRMICDKLIVQGAEQRIFFNVIKSVIEEEK